MPTQRSFLGNFLAAFRAHQQQLPKPGPGISSSAGASQTLWTSAAGTSSNRLTSSSGPDSSPARPHAKPNAYHPQTNAAATTTAATSASSASSAALLQHSVSPSTHLPRSTPSPGLPSYPTAQESQPWASARRARRGSDSSSDSGGFRDVRATAAGGEKWFVGGRTAAGEEKYYALAKIRRDRSSDRISTDQLSL